MGTYWFLICLNREMFTLPIIVILWGVRSTSLSDMTHLVLHCCHNSNMIKVGRPQLPIEATPSIIIITINLHELPLPLPSCISESTRWSGHEPANPQNRMAPRPGLLQSRQLLSSCRCTFVFYDAHQLLSSYFFLSHSLWSNHHHHSIHHLIHQTDRHKSTQCTHNSYVSQFIRVFTFISSLTLAPTVAASLSFSADFNYPLRAHYLSDV